MPAGNGDAVLGGVAGIFLGGIGGGVPVGNGLDSCWDSAVSSCEAPHISG